jgi:hypothetical protein
MTKDLTDSARILCYQGALATAAAAVLVYLLVRRETGERYPALLAMTLFGISTQYWEAVIWFAATFSVLALDMLLLGLLAAQRWRQTGQAAWLVVSAFWCGLAPGWFATGALAGPLCTLYLLGPDPAPPDGRPRWQRWMLSLVPLAGTAVALAITLPHNADLILHLKREGMDKTAWDTFSPRVGLEYTLRATVDDVLPGAIGIPSAITPVPWVWLCLAGLVAVMAWWWRIVPRRNLLLVGLAMVLTSLLLTYSGRAYLRYEQVHASRYRLLPHLGLVLIVCGAWPKNWSPALAAVPHWLIAAFIGALFATQAARPWSFNANEQQLADFRRIADVDARCRRYHIDAETARKALPEDFVINGCGPGQKVHGRTINGWDFLRGSAAPRPVSVEKARRRLVPEREP